MVLFSTLPLTHESQKLIYIQKTDPRVCFVVCRQSGLHRVESLLEFSNISTYLQYFIHCHIVMWKGGKQHHLLRPVSALTCGTGKKKKKS